MQKKAAELEKGDVFKISSWLIYKTVREIHLQPGAQKHTVMVHVHDRDNRLYVFELDQVVELADLRQMIGLSEKQLAHYRNSL